MRPGEISAYPILEELPGSDWAQTFKANDPQGERQVVVKILKNPILYSSIDKTKLEDRMGDLLGFHHRAIIPMLDYGEQAGRPFFVFPFLSGGSLSERLEAGPLGPAEINDIFTPLAEALDKAAEEGIFHQNLKPDNILFDDRDQPCLAELGILGLVDSFSAARLPIANPQYVTPERIHRQEMSASSHVYSLAAIVYQALTGQPVFQGATESITLFKHTGESPRPPSEIKPELPKSVDEVLLKGLQKDPGERYASAVEFIRALERAFEDILPPDGLDEFVEPVPDLKEPEPSIEIEPRTSLPREGSSGITTKVLIALAAAAAVTVLGIGIFVLTWVNERSVQNAADATASASAFNVLAMEAEALRIPASRWPLLIYDPFDTNEYDWFEGVEDDQYASLSWVIDGSYVWRATAKRDFVWRVWPRSDVVTDFYLSVEARNAGGNPDAQYGLILRNNEGSYYYLEMSDPNLLRFMVSIQGDWDTLIPQTEVASLRPGESNRLTVVAQGERFLFFANDLYVGETFDGRIAEGQNGLAIGLSEPGEETTIVFDNFELRAP